MIPRCRSDSLANRSANGVVLGFCIAILILNAGSHFVWAVPLLIVTRMAAGYPLRKILYRETWGLGGFLPFFLARQLDVPQFAARCEVPRCPSGRGRDDVLGV